MDTKKKAAGVSVKSNTEITITVGSRKKGIPFNCLYTVLSNTVGLLRSLEKQIDSDAGVEWQIVRAGMNSPFTMTLAPATKTKKAVSRRVVQDYITGFQALERGNPEETTFRGSDLETVKSLVSVLNRGVSSLKFESPDAGVAKATERVAVRADSIQRINRRFEFTTFQGRLEDVTTHDREFNFTIFDLLSGTSISCKFKPEDVERVGANLRKRVRVSGLACFEKDVPRSIEVHEFTGLSDNIVKFSEIPGVDITGGLDSADYVRAIRNGEIP